MRYLFFDVETTGLPKNRNAPLTELENWPRIVQIAWILYDEEGIELAKEDHIVKPEGFTIPVESSKIHGITNENAILNGENLEIIMKKFSFVLEESDLLIAHNIDFDKKIVGAEFLRKKINNNLFIIPKFCTMKSTTRFCKIEGDYGYKWPTQIELYKKLFGEEFSNAHNALVDSQMCAKCFFELKKRKII